MTGSWSIIVKHSLECNCNMLIKTSRYSGRLYANIHSNQDKQIWLGSYDISLDQRS